MSMPEEIVLWLDSRWTEAWQLHFPERDIQKEMVQRLDALLRELPQEVYDRISGEIASERMERERRREADRRFSLFQITEQGETTQVCLEHPMDFPNVGIALRNYEQQRKAGTLTRFRAYFSGALDMAEETYTALLAERMESSGRVVGVFHIDFDAHTVSVLSEENDWISYGLKDVKSAAYFANRRSGLSFLERASEFSDYLDGKELPQVRPEQTETSWQQTM